MRQPRSRSKKRKKPFNLTIASCLKMLKELYSPLRTGWSSKKKRIRTKVRKKYGPTFKEMINVPNPFLSMLPKEDFRGAYIPVPIVYGKLNE